MTERAKDIHQVAADCIRFLAADMVERASSGHPGLPMGAAEYVLTLWTRFLKQDPARPDWPDRDRFVLSAGHGSTLLYALLHLSGYDLDMEELRRFRQWGSRTPGHPERDPALAVETTTGPLGQGLSTAVGMAMAERSLAARFNRQERNLVDHRTYVLAGDGDIMEGVTHEASSLAGHLKLGRLIVLYDANRITIEGSTDLSFSEDVRRRYEALGWSTWEVDAYDQPAVARALEEAVGDEQHPSLLVCRSVIGRGAPTKEGSESTHGAPLGAEELRSAKERAGWPQKPFHVPPEVREYVASAAGRHREERIRWEQSLERMRSEDPLLGAEWDRRMEGRLPDGFGDRLLAMDARRDEATRKTSGAALQQIAAELPELIGGSADLAPSNNTLIRGESDFAPPDYAGRILRFGVREHAMGAVVNGLLAHGGFRAFGATFLVFSDYMRPAIRMAALMKLPAIYVFSHDSVYLGEDGPTHQPVEHLAALRCMPNLAVLRPADPAETVAAWRAALERTTGPTALVLTRQGVRDLGRTPAEVYPAFRRGARIVRDDPHPRLVLLATGSEVATALDAAEILQTEGIQTRVVSAPWPERMERPSDGAPPWPILAGRPLMILEAACSCGWRGFLPADLQVVGIDRFGASAPGAEAARRLGLEPERVAEQARCLLDRTGTS